VAFEAEFGQYPVLYIDFSVGNTILCSTSTLMERNDMKSVSASNMHDLLTRFKRCVSRAAKGLQDAGFFNNSQELSPADQLLLQNIIMTNLKDEQWAMALFDLTRMLHILSGRRVIVLWDEYDTPTSSAAQSDYFSIVSFPV
jgi:hypothetical protein